MTRLIPLIDGIDYRDTAADVDMGMDKEFRNNPLKLKEQILTRRSIAHSASQHISQHGTVVAFDGINPAALYFSIPGKT